MDREQGLKNDIHLTISNEWDFTEVVVVKSNEQKHLIEQTFRGT
jgi:hypothetical protein